ncbi:ArnT family glycosyltransferase [Candidatus Korobacter versatilis]|nr:glycosyltransferase family 39 protein [Candidatus Koribacter versatilis]
MPLAVLTRQHAEERNRARWTSGITLVLVLAGLRLVVYAVAGPNYGYFRDELYYLACGEHPAWGYVDQPPMIGWLAWLLQHTIGTSLYALRLLPALAHAGSIFLAGMLARELGGRRWAMFLAALATLMAPIGLAFGHLFTMNAFDPLLWVAIAYCVVRIVNTGNQRLWLAVGGLTGITLLNKYGIAFWIVGLIVGVVLTPLRSSLKQKWFWLGCLLGAAICLPNFLWQWKHHFPFLELMRNVRESGRDVVLGPLGFLKAQLEMIGFAAGILVIASVIYGFTKAGRSYRTLNCAFLVFLLAIMGLHGKTYYVAAVYPIVFAGGAVGLGAATQKRGWVWVKPLTAVLIAAISLIYAPMIVPILPVDKFIAYEEKMGIHQQKFEHQREGKLPQLYADMFGWEQMVQKVAAYYNTLSPEEKAKTAIFANNYGDAGAIDFFGPKYGLPKSIGNHQSYWIWGPRQYTGESLIVLGDDDERNMQTKCASYSIIGTAEYPLSRPDEWLNIYHCRGFKWNLQEIWPKTKHFN